MRQRIGWCRSKHGDLDVLGTIDDTVVHEDVLQQTIEVEVSEFRVLALELERLIQAKEFAGRPKDMAALPVLRATLAELKKSREQG
jgi:predicted nucleotidyltransferase